MLVIISLLIMVILSVFSLILGNIFLASTTTILTDNVAIVDGITSTLLVEGQDVIFSIDTSVLISSGIALLVTVGIVAGLTGITVLGTGLNPQSAKIIIMFTAYTGVWTSLTLITFSLINEIAFFGSIIYIGLTIAYAIGVIQKISGSE